MATLEQEINLAKALAQRLPEVTRNEWMRWLQLVERYGVLQAVQHAQRLSQDVTLRPALQRANRLIAQAMRERQSELQQLTENELSRVLGFVAWLLQIKTVRGSSQGPIEDI
ncbi:MAG TPA: hypothetical protein VNL95_01570 [Dehalococcoidia bacterium]|nr:hypothetical protein [Dehalococcoidia bacterium]